MDSVVLFSGSRQVDAEGVALVRRLVAVWGAGQARGIVGDASGVDYNVARAAVDQGYGSRLSVSLAKPFKQQSFLWRQTLQPHGLPAPSALPLRGSVVRAPIAARLAARSMVCVAAASSGFVVLSSPSSRGSLATAASLAALNKSVVVFTLYGSPPPLLGAGDARPFGSLVCPGGSWVPVSLSLVGAGWRWVSSQPSLFSVPNLK
jgi:hypothetical protein